jgi:hypothetical protein
MPITAAFKFKLFDDKTGEQVEHELPGKRVICAKCDGTGTHVNPNVDGPSGLSSEDFDEDPDFKRDYFAGVYDVTCTNCEGEKVVVILNRRRALKTNPELLQRYEDDRVERTRESYEEAHLRRMEMGERY